MTCSIERCRAFGAAETRCPAGVSYVGQWSRAVLPAGSSPKFWKKLGRHDPPVGVLQVLVQPHTWPTFPKPRNPTINGCSEFKAVAHNNS